MDLDSLSYFAAFAGSGGFAALIALLAALRDRSQRRRRDLDRISVVPWGLISALFSMLAIMLIATAAKIWFAPGS
ncbi:hypothetical protein [Novosphingobium sp. PASSN1]|uniref:hypothetical protein n=1 Tax=Novosphingobium sp. PASSN1 TaxID=2015561 RepID=UPI000BD5BB3D|nr:hypothetical protein [Novosphingobium sp. PASSN1]OYU35816.1 MAG: hypothetical protein CFE35_05840 [Novosphingobium sp. PASSN1]